MHWADVSSECSSAHVTNLALGHRHLGRTRIANEEVKHQKLCAVERAEMLNYLSRVRYRTSPSHLERQIVRGFNFAVSQKRIQ